MQQLAEICFYSGEEIVASVGATGQAASQQTYLTSTSVSQVTREWGYEKYVCIPLNQLSDISHEHSNPVLYALLATLFFLTCVALAVASARNCDDSSLLVILAAAAGVVAVISFLMYFTRRTQSMVLSSSTAKIRVELSGTSEEAVRGFMTHLHQRMRTTSSPDPQIGGP